MRNQSFEPEYECDLDKLSVSRTARQRGLPTEDIFIWRALRGSRGTLQKGHWRSLCRRVNRRRICPLLESTCQSVGLPLGLLDRFLRASRKCAAKADRSGTLLLPPDIYKQLLPVAACHHTVRRNRA